MDINRKRCVFGFPSCPRWNDAPTPFKLLTAVLLLIVFGGLMVGRPLSAQFPRPAEPGPQPDLTARPLCQTSSIVLNTGFDEGSGAKLAIGSGDNSWKVVDDGDPTTTEPRPSAVIQAYIPKFRPQEWNDPQTDSQWISAYATAIEQDSNYYVFEYCFCLLDGYKNPRLDLKLRADDWAEVFLNGVNLGKTGEKSWKSYLDPHHIVAVNLPMDDPRFKRGRNCIRVGLKNTNQVAMGLNLVGTVTTDGLGLSRAACCNPTGSISGLKWHDLNGDGQRRSNEPVLEGWPIQVSDGQNAVTVSTDSKGYYSVDRPPGTYTVTEQLQAGWQQTFPSSGSHPVTIEPGETFNGKDFGNRKVDFSINLTPSNEEGCDRFSGNNGKVEIEIQGEGTPPFACCGPGYPDPPASPECRAPGGTDEHPCCGKAQLASCSFSGVTAGNHDYRVTDANGVFDTETIKVHGAVEIEVAKKYPTFPGCSDGSITVKGVGDVPPFEFRWDHLDDVPADTGLSSTTTDLSPDAYRVIVTDPRGCHSVAEIDLKCALPCVGSGYDPAPKSYLRLASRVDGEGTRTLLVRAAHEGAETVDEVLLTLTKKAARLARPLRLPTAWSLTREGATLRLSGPPIPPPVYAKLGFGSSEVPSHVGMEVLSAGRSLSSARMLEVPEVGPVQVADDLQGLLQLPPVLAPGDRLQFAPLDPVRTPADGQWTIAGEVVEAEPELPDSPCPLGPPWTVELPLDLTSIAVSYIDPFGDPVVDVPRPSEVTVGPPIDYDPEPEISGSTDLGIAGGLVCACGNFPDSHSRNSLLIDSQPLGAPASASSRVVYLRLPEDLPPGAHTLRGWAGAGFAARDARELEVIEVQARLDSNELFRGGSTTLHLETVGSEKPISLNVRNLTPGIISLEGGQEQIVTTVGGKPNTASVSVRAVGRGTFDIQWELDVESCACAMVDHPYSGKE